MEHITQASILNEGRVLAPAGLGARGCRLGLVRLNLKCLLFGVLFCKSCCKKPFNFLISFDFAALYGVLFESDEEAAFSNYRLWESLGFIFAYILQTQVCIYSKLWVIIAVLGTGIGGYMIIEVQEFLRKKSSRNNTA